MFKGMINLKMLLIFMGLLKHLFNFENARIEPLLYNNKLMSIKFWWSTTYGSYPIFKLGVIVITILSIKGLRL